MNMMKSGMKRGLTALLALAAVSTFIVPAQGAAGGPAARAHAAGGKEMETLRQRIYDALLPAASASAATALQALSTAARSHLASLGPDGSWPDVDYQDKARSAWKTMAHLNRLLLMAKAYRAPGHALHNDPALKAKLLSALDFW